MILRDIDFGTALGASGVQGFFGEGYPMHRYWKLMFPGLFSFEGITFVAKTTTFEGRAGNMPLRSDRITPVELKPKCVFVNARSFSRGAALNSVSLSGPGAPFLLGTGRWRKRKDSFFNSFMSVATTKEERLKELSVFVSIFLQYLPHFQGKVGLQMNFSCPNVGIDPTKLLGEIFESLEIASVLGIPLVPKINLLVNPWVAAEIANCPYCDAICVSNTLPWGTLPDKIDWKGIFGTDESPLKLLGGGGLSGSPLFPLLLKWMDDAQGIVKKPIIAGGGIMSAQDVKMLSYTHPAAVSLGTIAMLRPWRLASTIRAAKQYIK